MSRGLHLHTALGAIRIASSLEYQDMLRAVGIQDSEWKLLTSSQPWIAKNRHTIERLLKHLIFAGLDLSGIPRISVPAEYVCGVLSSYISPVNHMHASYWIGSYARAEELGNYDGSRQGNIEGLDTCTPEQLFALLCILESDTHAQQLNRRFNDKAVEALESTIIESEVKDEKKK